jgi:signal peptidase
VVHAYDFVTSAGAVVLVGLLLVAVSGVWPPLVAIESGSMEPNIQAGDLVFVMDENRFYGPGALGETGVVTARQGSQNGYGTFAGGGDVIVFQPGGDDGQTPIIHRAMFWVEAGENWHARADPRSLGGAEDCGDLVHCPAPHAGFITKGDNNGVYDQVGNGRGSEPVRPSWVVGTAEYRVPYLGWLRLEARSVLGAPAAEVRGSRLGKNGTSTDALATA